jgi:hypothetical protein
MVRCCSCHRLHFATGEMLQLAVFKANGDTVLNSVAIVAEQASPPEPCHKQGTAVSTHAYMSLDHSA